MPVRDVHIESKHQRRVWLQSKMPLAKVRGRVTCVLQQLGQGCDRWIQPSCRFYVCAFSNAVVRSHPSSSARMRTMFFGDSAAAVAETTVRMMASEAIFLTIILRLIKIPHHQMSRSSESVGINPTISISGAFHLSSLVSSIFFLGISPACPTSSTRHARAS